MKAQEYIVGNKEFRLLDLAVYTLTRRLYDLRPQKYKMLQFGYRQAQPVQGTKFSLTQKLRKIRNDLLYKTWTDLYILHSLLFTI
jgi:hypothetical protein